MEDWLGITRVENDAMGRAVKVTGPDRKEVSYTYDAFGNRTGVTGESGVTRYAYNALNQLVSKTDAENETTYRYDRRGNLSLVLENNHMKNAYVYGAINRLEEAWNAQGDVSRYLYNGIGRRVGKEAAGKATTCRMNWEARYVLWTGKEAFRTAMAMISSDRTYMETRESCSPSDTPATSMTRCQIPTLPRRGNTGQGKDDLTEKI